MLLDLQGKLAAKAQAQQVEFIAKTRQEWVESLKTDKEYGGVNFQKTVDDANYVLRRYGSQKLVDDLKAWNIGDCPELIKMFSRIRKDIGEGRSLDGHAAPAEKIRRGYLFLGTRTALPPI